MKSGKIEEGRRAILNPQKLSAVASVDFCGACHRTWADVLQTQVTGVANVRFQPYRLESSKCWGRGDARLAFHGVDRIMPGTSTLVPEGGRINLTLRRVRKPEGRP